MDDIRRLWFAALALLAFFGNTTAVPADFYHEDELGDITVTVTDASGIPEPGVQVYMTDTEWQYEDMGETDSAGRVRFRDLYASPGQGYQFYTFIDGYFLQNSTAGIEAGKNTDVGLKPDAENRMGISIEMVGDCVFPCSERLVFFVNIDNGGTGGESFAEVLAYDDNGRLIRTLCDGQADYSFNYTRSGGWFPWLGFGYDLRVLSDSQKSWLDERTGELCIGDLSDTGGICGYPGYDNPVKRREENSYKPECPVGGMHHIIQNPFRYLNVISLPEGTKKVTVRAIGFDSEGDQKIVEKTLERDDERKSLAWPCCPCSGCPMLFLSAAAFIAAANAIPAPNPIRRMACSARIAPISR